jgi:uncharacterized membrane protein YcjF (UPF0283 family)
MFIGYIILSQTEIYIRLGASARIRRWCLDTQHNATQHNDIHHYRLNCDAEQKQHSKLSGIMLSVAIFIVTLSVIMLNVQLLRAVLQKIITIL